MTHVSRRGFLAASAAAAVPLALPARSFASQPAFVLRATTRTLDIAGRAITVKGLLDPQGRSGLVLDPAQPSIKTRKVFPPRGDVGTSFCQTGVSG
jgi:hypothetical protein